MASMYFSRNGLFRKASVTALLALSLAGCSGGLFGGGDDKKTTPTLGVREPVLSRIETGASVDPALAAVAVVLPPAQVNADWSMASATASKSYGHLALAENPSRLWTATIPGASNRVRFGAAPVIGDGKLFVVDTEGTVNAFDANTGSKVWSHRIEVDKSSRNSAFGGGVSYSGGRVYATNGVGEVVALDADAGTEIWKVKPAGPLRDAPTLAFNLVIVMTQNNKAQIDQR